jgi:hypothetical protein
VPSYLDVLCYDAPLEPIIFLFNPMENLQLVPGSGAINVITRSHL